jgi:hypothetical protein
MAAQPLNIEQQAPAVPPEAYQKSQPIGAPVSTQQSGSYSTTPESPIVVHFPHPTQSMNVAFPRLMSFSDIEAAAKRIYAEHIAPTLSDAGTALKQDVQGMVSSPSVNDVLRPNEQMKQQALQPPLSMAEQGRVQNYDERLAGYSLPYRATAGAASALGMNVEGTEQAAKEGSVGGVIGHAATPLVQLAAGELLGRAIPEAPRLLREERGEAEVPFTKTRKANEESSTNAPTFFSKLERVANEKVNAASGDQILSTLRNNGVKESEIQWTGVDDYLKGKAKVSKADLQQYINDHKIELKDVNLGVTPESEQHTQLAKQRDKLYAENNRIWQDNFKYDPTGLFTELVQAMKQGTDLGIKQTIDKMPDAYKQPARRFVQTDRQVVDLDNQMSKLQYQIDHSGVQEPRYEKYTLAGEKSNYQEKLLMLPDRNEARIADITRQLDEMSNRPAAEHAAHPEWKDEWDRLQTERTRLSSGKAAQQAYDDFVQRMQNKYMAGGQWAQKINAAEEAERVRLSEAVRNVRESETNKFQSTHFDQPNVVAHVRYSDRPALDGKKTLFLEEAQSDWAQKGKQEGYNDPNVRTALEKQIADLEQERAELMHSGNGPEGAADDKQIARYEEINRTLTGLKRTFNATHKGVPDMPFKQTWHELVMKRMLRHAAENGYDRLAWTTGEQQAERYDLSKHVSEVSYDPEEHELYARDHSGKEVIHETGVAPEQIADYIGKEPAQKLIKAANDWKSSYNTDDWKVEPQEFKPKPEDEISREKAFNTLTWGKKITVGTPAEFGYNYKTLDHENQVHFTPENAKFYSGSKSFFVRNPNGDLWLERDGKPTTFNSEKDAKKFIESMAEQDKRAEGLPKLSGLDLKVGGEWARNLYDEMIPSFLNKYGKRWGAKVGQTQITSGNSLSIEYDPKYQKEPWHVVQHGRDGRKLLGTWKSEAAAKTFLNDRQKAENTTVHSIEITPEMKKSVLQGQPIAKAQPAWVGAVQELAKA